MSAYTLTTLNATLGAYFREQNSELVSKLLVGMNIEDRMTIEDGVKDERVLGVLNVEDIVKPYSKANSGFNPTANAIDFKPRILKVRKAQVDLELHELDLENSYYGFLRSQGSNYSEITFEAYLFDEITKKIAHQLRMQTLFGGVYNASGTNAIAVCDGFKKLIADEISGGAITPIATGTISDSNVKDKVYQVYDSVGEPYKMEPLIGLVSPQVYDWFVRKWRADHGANNNYQGITQNEFPVEGTMLTIKREPGLTGSSRIIITTKNNICVGADSFSEINNLRTQEYARTIRVLADFKMGVQFREVHGEALAVNDQA